MAILQKQKAKRPETGYAGDFLLQMRDVLVAVHGEGRHDHRQRGRGEPGRVRVRRVEALAAELGVADKVKVGRGRRRRPLRRPRRADSPRGETLANMETGRAARPRSAIRCSPRTSTWAPARSCAPWNSAPTSSSPAASPTPAVTLGADDPRTSAGPRTTGTGSPPASSPATSSSAAASAPAATSPTGTWCPDHQQHGLPAGRGARRRHLRRHQAPRHRRPGLRPHRHRAAALRDGRARLPLPGLHRPLRLDPADPGGPGPRPRRPASRGGPPPEQLKVAVSYVRRLPLGRPDPRLGPGHPGEGRTRRPRCSGTVAGGHRNSTSETYTQFLGWDASHPPLGSRGTQRGARAGRRARREPRARSTRSSSRRWSSDRCCSRCRA